MRSGKKILIITPGFPENEADYLCIPALQTFVRLLSQRHEVVVYALEYPYRKGEYHWHGVKVMSAGGKNKKRNRLWAGARFRNWFRRQPRPDIVHTFWWGPAARMGNDLNKRLHLPHVCTLMGQDVLPSNSYVKLLSRNHSRQVAISDRQARLFLQSTGQECSAVIPFGLDASLKIDHLPDTVRDIDVLGVGGLIQLKNYSAFVDAIASVRDQYPGVKAVLIGAGEEQKMLEAKIASLGLSGNLTLIPGLPRTEVLEYMLRSKYFFHPSRYESLGYVFLEAMSRGMEIISLPVGAAFHHARWSIETDTQGMTRVLMAKMGQAFTPEMVWMGSVDDTVSAYERMFDELLQS